MPQTTRKRETTMKLTDRETAIVLEGLRLMQDSRDVSRALGEPEEHEEVTIKEIDDLCERINTDDDQEQKAPVESADPDCPGCDGEGATPNERGDVCQCVSPAVRA